jgi:mannose-6-phosphate isomerase-like protein (cupin superfamily)
VRTPDRRSLKSLSPPLERVDVRELVSARKDRWYNQTLCKVNESMARLGIMQGEYHWHKHDNDDEFFFVLDGTFYCARNGNSVVEGSCSS